MTLRDGARIIIRDYNAEILELMQVVHIITSVVEGFK
jgi:hypothetical protein